MLIIYDSELREQIDTEGVPVKTLEKWLDTHEEECKRYEKLDKYYHAKHPEILERKMTDGIPNNKLVFNYPRYITDISNGYLFGKPVTYTEKKDIKKNILKTVKNLIKIGNTTDISELQDVLDRNDAEYKDTELGKDVSIFGVGYELHYANENSFPCFTFVDPRSAFVVFDDTVEQRPICGVYFYKNDEEYRITIYTDHNKHKYSGKKGALTFINTESHGFSRVPLIEYQNNEDQIGDFEQVISLIDAYNKLVSDCMNATESDIDAILAIYGMETPDEDGVKRIKEDKIMTLATDAKAEWLIKNLSQSDKEILRKALKADIHKFSFTPDMSDENFAGNSSGVAIEYKLLPFEWMIAVKERYFKLGLRERLRLIYSYLQRKGKTVPDVYKIQITLVRNLPTNLLEVAQVIEKLQGLVSDKTLISRLDFVEDVDEELEEVKQQKEDNVKRQKQMFESGD